MDAGTAWPRLAFQSGFEAVESALNAKMLLCIVATNTTFCTVPPIEMLLA